MTANESLKIRNMTREELNVATSWAAKEGWNPGLNDADIFWQTDPQGFIALEQDGEMVGSGSIVFYNGKFGFMGFFIVKQELRGQGLGTKLWFYRRDHLLSRLDKDAAIGMDGVFDMQPFYTKGGFQFSHRDLRMESTATTNDFDKNVQSIAISDFAAINAYDQGCFGFERETFLKSWLNMKDSKALKYQDAEGLKGYGVVRKCVTGYKIGPLFAESYHAASELFKALSSYAAGNQIFLDVPEINSEGLRLAKEYAMKECFGCAKMYFGLAPKLPYEKIFWVTTFELG
ncbi:MAG: GNAT family N-acetyltransferase [Patescibacteria group bacterium]